MRRNSLPALLAASIFFTAGLQAQTAATLAKKVDDHYNHLGSLRAHFTEHYTDFAPDAAGNQLTVGNYSIWNGYVSYKPIPALKLLVGINNLADTNPPFSNQEQNWQAGYNPIFSDPLGRTFYGRVTFDF